MEKIKIAILVNSLLSVATFLVLHKVAGTGGAWKIVFASVGFIGFLTLTLRCMIEFNKIRKGR